MKQSLFIFLFFVALHAHGVTWKVFGPCDDKPVAEGAVAVDLSQSVGEISIEIFQANKIPYVGVPEGFNSILNTPIGIDAIEVVSDTELRAYGWCYTVNGKIPEEMPHQKHLVSQSDKLIWFYGYSTNKNNEWQDDYCSPAYWIKARQFCGK